VPFAATDAWSTFLEWLATIIIPDWNGLINLLPILVLLGVTGPGLSLLMLYWLYHAFIDRRGRVQILELEPSPAGRRGDGTPIFPPNVPYCIEHELIYPATARNCDIDGAELVVRCPVDDTARTATEQLCRVCGTRYQLGASLAPVTVRRTRRPPEGGAAVA
jgi:hypothetical protein